MKLATLVLTVVAVSSSLLPVPCAAQSGNWQTLRTNFTISYDLVFTSDDTGYVAGFHTVLKTTDGGTSFTPLALPIDTGHTTFESMSWPTPRIGYVWGSLDSSNTGLKSISVLLKTTDAGNNWVRLPLDSTFSHARIVFPTPQIGYYVAYAANAGSSLPARLAKSTDGGLTWKNFIYDKTFLVTRMKFRNENEGFFGHEYQLNPTSLQLVFTGDGLATTQIRDDSLTPIGDITSILPTSDGAWLITADGKYARSTDQGRSWKILAITGEDYAGLLAGSGNLVFEANQNLSVDTVRASIDYGKTWTATTALSDKGFVELLAMPSKNAAYLTMQSDNPDSRKVIMKWTNTAHLAVESPLILNGGLSVGYDGSAVEFRYPAQEVGSSIRLFDVLGRKLMDLQTNSGCITQLNAHCLRPGVYFATLFASRVKFIISAR